MLQTWEAFPNPNEPGGARFDFLWEHDVARDPVTGAYLSASRGRAKGGTGYNYHLNLPKQPGWEWSKHLHFKAWSDEEALEVAQKRLEKYTLLPVDTDQLCGFCRETLARIGRIVKGAPRCTCTWEGYDVPLKQEA